jgi:hypothetical protein
VNWSKEETLQLLADLASELDAVRTLRPRTFDAGLVSAQLAVEDIAKVFIEGRLPLTANVDACLRELEAALGPGQAKPELDKAKHLFKMLRSDLVHIPILTVNYDRYIGVYADASGQGKPQVPSRRTRCVEGLSVRLLEPVHRERYREEWRAEILSLPRRDQAPHALRLLSRAWFMRRELSDKPPKNPRNFLLIVGVAIPGADAVVALCGLDWPATVVGIGWTLGLTWIIASKDRTQRLVTLIRAVNSSKVSTRKQDPPR